jgi:hypothetical protein
MLRDLQKLLSSIYGIDQNLDVYDYLVTDAKVLAEWETPETDRRTEEKLLIQEFEDELGMLLFLDAELLERLSMCDPRHRLGLGNLSDFCKAVEGISHLSCLAWNAGSDKSVTLMELEMQAEVDKYVGARILLEQQPDNGLADSLFSRLFDDPTFDEQLPPDELARYQDASGFAGQYCRSLEKRFSPKQVCFDMIRDLRAFYRLPQPDKISHIQAASFA